VLLGGFTAPFAHGLLVVAAPESADPHDGWDVAEHHIHAGRDSLYCGVRQAASGLVTVSCVEAEAVQTEPEEVLACELFLPSARLEFYDPNQSVRLIVPVSEEHMRVTVYADDADEPAQLLFHLWPLQ
jgi:hypothetical protein